MTWTELNSADAVRKALKEFDDLGRDAFLKKYRFGRSARFVVSHAGREYDAKAVIGAAHGHQFPHKGPLKSADFPSSERVVKGTLEKLGFTVSVR
jgi:putative restriction endonuclease